MLRAADSKLSLIDEFRSKFAGEVILNRYCPPGSRVDSEGLGSFVAQSIPLAFESAHRHTQRIVAPAAPSNERLPFATPLVDEAELVAAL